MGLFRRRKPQPVPVVDRNPLYNYPPALQNRSVLGSASNVTPPSYDSIRNAGAYVESMDPGLTTLVQMEVMQDLIDPYVDNSSSSQPDCSGYNSYDSGSTYDCGSSSYDSGSSSFDSGGW